MRVQLAQSARDLTELFEEPALTVACVLLIVASVGWIVMSRLIVRQIRRAALRAQAAPLDVIRPPKDIWSYPPPPHVDRPPADDDELVVAVDHMYIYDFSEEPIGTDGASEERAHDTAVIRLEEQEPAH